MDMTAILAAIEKNVPKAEEEYLGDDGFLHCGVCHCKVQHKVFFLGKESIVRCICDCKINERKEYEIKMRKEMQDRARKVCFAETNMWNWTFENDNKKNKQLSDAMETYAFKFDEFLKKGQGLLLWGSVGTGKTYYAACIANRLIDQGYKALMTSVSKLTNQIQSTFDGKQELIDDLNRYHLLVIDDLGIERKTEYMQEMMFNIIDARYRSGLPLIVTTNIKIDEFKNPEELACKRIYDRVLERCFPVEMNGNSNRHEAIRDRYFDVKEKLGL